MLLTGQLSASLPGGAALSSSWNGVVTAATGRGPRERPAQTQSIPQEGPETAQPPHGDARGSAPVTEPSRRQPPPREPVARYARGPEPPAASAPAQPWDAPPSRALCARPLMAAAAVCGT